MKSLKAQIGTNRSPLASQKRITLDKPKSAASSALKPQPKEAVVVNVAAAFGSQVTRGKLINLKILLKCTNEKFSVSNFPIILKVRDLKGLLEFICGIPYNLQRLSYLDDGELIDNKDIQYYDIIDGACIIMDIWTIYVGLVQAAVGGNIDDALKQGISHEVEWKSPTADHMYTKDKNKYVAERSGIALFIASHRGNAELVQNLLAHGANINYKTSFGRTPVMQSVVANRIHIIDFLLDQNVDIDAMDINGDSALTIARKFNNKAGQYRLTQFKWKKRTEAEMKAKRKNHQEPDEIFSETRLPHQIFDSSKKTWFKGNFMQVYMMQVCPQSEFSGGSLSAPKSIGKEVLKRHKLSRSTSELKLRAENDENPEISSPIETGLTFDKWLAQKEKIKRIQKQQKLKEAQLSNSEKEETFKDPLATAIDPETNNVWMKDYNKNGSASRNEIIEINSISPRKNANFQKTKISDLSSNSFTSSSIGKSKNSTEIGNVYKGMSYEEWVKIRDQFLKSHNML